MRDFSSYAYPPGRGPLPPPSGGVLEVGLRVEQDGRALARGAQHAQHGGQLVREEVVVVAALPRGQGLRVWSMGEYGARI